MSFPQGYWTRRDFSSRGQTLFYSKFHIFICQKSSPIVLHQYYKIAFQAKLSLNFSFSFSIFSHLFGDIGPCVKTKIYVGVRKICHGIRKCKSFIPFQVFFQEYQTIYHFCERMQLTCALTYFHVFIVITSKNVMGN